MLVGGRVCCCFLHGGFGHSLKLSTEQVRETDADPGQKRPPWPACLFLLGTFFGVKEKEEAFGSGGGIRWVPSNGYLQMGTFKKDLLGF